jgi:threonine dehydrogenase-like Zn-dependent dehydrogenase
VNPNAAAVGGIYGYSHTAGGYDGGQAEFVRVPFADVGPSRIPEWMDEEDAVLLTDACPTGYFGAELGEIKERDVVVVFGAGPVGLFAARSSWLMGAGRVIVVDHLDYRLEVARTFAQAETINFTEVDDIVLHLKQTTGGLGADVCIEAVGAEADGVMLQHVAAATLKLQGGSAVALNWAIDSVRKAGNIAVVGAFGRDAECRPDRRRDEQGPHHTDQPDEREAPLAAAVRARADRDPEAARHRHPSPLARVDRRWLSHVLEQARQLREAADPAPGGLRRASCRTERKSPR